MSYLANLKNVHTFLFDVDGVLTDGRILVTDQGEFLRQMHTRDGFALKYAIMQGFNIVIITGGSSIGVEKRLRLLGIEHVYSGISDKAIIYSRWLEKHPCDPAGILYMGDDLPDYEVMKLVGVPCCPADSDPLIMGLCVYVSPIAGGQGCVRDVIEKTLRIQGKWDFA